MAWLLRCFDDVGNLYSPQLKSGRRQRIVWDGVEYWVARVPKR